MRYYNKISYWENKRRLERLYEFRALVNTYADNSELNWKTDSRIESKKAADARVEINRGIAEFHSIIVLSGLKPVMTYTPPAAIGGYVQRVDLIINFFNLGNFEIGMKEVLDWVDRSIGVYENDKKRAYIRTFNPLFWFGLLLDYVVAIPFSLLAKAGFNRTKIEDSFIGRIAKFVLYVFALLASLLGIIASLLTIVQALGYLDTLKDVLREVYSVYY